MKTPTLTIFAKKNGPLSKHVRLESGVVKSDGSACVMSIGSAERCDIETANELADLIADLKSNEALGLGTLRGDLPDRVTIATKAALGQVNGEVRPDIIARTGSNIIFEPDRPAWALLDHDGKDMPPEVKTRLAASGGFWRALCGVLPDLAETERVSRASTSAGLFSIKNGERLDYAGSNGRHVYLLVRDGADIPRFLQALHDRCWLAGLGWYVVGAGGQLLDRSMIDRMVGLPERLVFEGPPVLEPPLEQDKAARQPVPVSGRELDTFAACPPLTVAEKAALAELKAKAKAALASEAAKVRDSFIADRVSDLVKRTNISEEAARRVIAQQCEGTLLPGVELPFDDPALAGKTVGDVLADPDRFVGETLADPIEGIDYGRGKAKIMRRADGSVWIHSFAHGRTTYDLKYDAAAVRAAIEAAAKDDAFKIFTKFFRHAALDAVEQEQLRALVAKHAGVGAKVVSDALKAERAKAAADAARAEKERELAERTDPRPQLARPRSDAPWGDVTSIIDEVLMKQRKE
ncbi:MAG: hypothetical protein U1E81_13720 [Xanthobacteraceae bacterium]